MADPDIIFLGGKDSTGHQTLAFTKRVNGYVVSVNAIRVEKRTLTAQTVYVTQSEPNAASLLPHPPSEKEPPAYVRNRAGGQHDANLPQNKPKIKRSKPETGALVLPDKTEFDEMVQNALTDLKGEFTANGANLERSASRVTQLAFREAAGYRGAVGIVMKVVMIAT